MKNNTLIHLQDLNLFEMFTIPSIGLTGTLLDCNISSAKVVYHNMQISDKMGKNVAKKEVTELIVDFGIFGEYTPDKKTKYTKLEVFKALKDFNID